MEPEVMICVWLVSMFLNFEAGLLNKSKTSLWFGGFVFLVENYILYEVGSKGLILVLPLSILSIPVSLKIAASFSEITGRIGNPAQNQ